MDLDLEPPLLPLQGARIPITRQPSRRTQQQTQLQPQIERRDFARTPNAPRRTGSTRDAPNAKRPPPIARRGTGDRSTTISAGGNKPRSRIQPHPIARPLLPVTERKSQEENAALRRPRKESDADKWDITPDGGSAGREGRQFAVANVGNNGRIYLRYVPLVESPPEGTLSGRAALFALELFCESTVTITYESAVTNTEVRQTHRQACKSEVSTAPVRLSNDTARNCRDRRDSNRQRKAGRYAEHPAAAWTSMDAEHRALDSNVTSSTFPPRWTDVEQARPSSRLVRLDDSGLVHCS